MEPAAAAGGIYVDFLASVRRIYRGRTLTAPPPASLRFASLGRR